MALRANVRKTDNSRLGRKVLNNRAGVRKPDATVVPTPKKAVKKKKVSVKVEETASEDAE